jgi:hypothetical protein
MAVLIVVIAILIRLTLPVRLIQVSANMSNLGALIYPFILIYLNSKLPRAARPSWWQYAVLLIAVVFFGFFFINFVVEFFTGQPVVAF